MAAKAKVVVEKSFAAGVQTIETLAGRRVRVSGRITGTVRPGTEVAMSNPGVDLAFGRTVVEEVIMPSGSVNVASDCIGGLVLKVPEEIDIRIGSVIYTEDMTDKQINDAYIAAIGDIYVARKSLDLSDEELEFMSIADLTESWRLYGWFQSQMGDKITEDVIEADKKKVEKLAAVLCKKIIEADYIYVVYNKKTDEPHMFASIARQGDGQYMCTSPDMLVIPKSYYKAVAKMYDTGDYELRKIENTPDKKGIYNFLGYSFYINGAAGIAVISGKTSIDRAMLVPEPDYSNVPESSRPVNNPNLMRWMLLYAQLGEPDTEDKKIISNLFYTFISRELVNARLLIPMKKNADLKPSGENGQVEISSDTEIILAVSKGKYDRNAVRMYTDWKRLRMEFNEEWDALVQPVDGMISTMDCVINATKCSALTYYISEATFEEMKKIQ